MAWIARAAVLPLDAPDHPSCPHAGNTEADEICQAIKVWPEVLFVAAAGNLATIDFATRPRYPAASSTQLTNLLAVGAVLLDDVWASSRGDAITLAGIGDRCPMIGRHNVIVRIGGGASSLAAGFTAGAAALLWAEKGSLTAEGVKARLEQRARLAGNPTYKDCCRRCGVLDVSNALDLGATSVQRTTPGCPRLAPSMPASRSFTGGAAAARLAAARRRP